MRCFQETVIGEVGHIGGNLPGIQCRQHGVIIHDLATSQIHEAHPLLHGGKSLCIDHFCRIGGVQGVDGNIIGLLIKFLYIFHHMDVAVKTQSRINRQERIVTVHIHAQLNSHICHQSTDGTEANDTEGLVVQLRTDKCGLPLLHHFGNLNTCSGLLTYPADTAGNVTGTHQQGAQHQFLHRIGVGTGGVKYGNARLAAAFQGDIVDTCTGASDGQQTLGELIVVHLGRTDENTFKAVLVTANHILSGVKSL